MSGLFVLQKHICLFHFVVFKPNTFYSLSLFSGPHRQNKEMEIFVKVFALFWFGFFFLPMRDAFQLVIWVLPSVGSALLCTFYPNPTPLRIFLLTLTPA